MNQYIETKRKMRDRYHFLLQNIRHKAAGLCTEDKFWTYFDMKYDTLPVRGFKIHLSGTILNAARVLSMFWAYAQRNKISWKVISDYRNIERQNLGQNGYSQIGKFITIYPSNDDVFARVIADLEILFKGMRGIEIPSDFSYMHSEVVYYRYGEFKQLPDYIDRREKQIPPHIVVPVFDYYIKRYHKFPDHIRLLSAKQLTGKGGLYLAYDAALKEVVYIKEALPLGNIDIWGSDAVNRLMNERNVMKRIEQFDFVPHLKDEFYVEKSYFLEVSKINGMTLMELFTSGVKFQSLKEKLEIIIVLCEQMGGFGHLCG